MSVTRSAENDMSKKKARAHGEGDEEDNAAAATANDNCVFDTDQFIEEIKQRPAIYAQNSDEYLDRNAKSEAWCQVCKIMIPKWDTFSDEKKNDEEKILRGKWRNIRDYFVKELKLQNSTKDSANNRKRKKYVYFEKLLFLKINEGKRPIRVATNNVKGAEDDAESSEPVFIDCQTPSAAVPAKHTANEQHHVNNRYVALEGYPKSICVTKMSTEVDDVLGNADCINQREEDYDKMFLLSLLPTFRKVPEDKKLDVRIEISQVLANATRNMNNCEN